MVPPVMLYDPEFVSVPMTVCVPPVCANVPELIASDVFDIDPLLTPFAAIAAAPTSTPVLELFVLVADTLPPATDAVAVAVDKNPFAPWAIAEAYALDGLLALAVALAAAAPL
jgi:hypothetical protein